MVLNSSVNENVSEAFNLEYLEFRITKISLYILIFTLSCIGNSLVAIVIIRAKGTWTSANVLILNLALCDLILPTLSIPFDLALEEVNYIWPFGSGMCRVLWPFQTAFSTSSSLTLVAISLDRYRTIGKPLSRRVSTGKILVFSSTIHVISIGLCVPYFIALDYNEAQGYCVESWSNFSHRQAYTIVLFLCQYALPLVTMCVAYLLIYRSLRLNTARLFSANRKGQHRRNSSRLSTIMDDMEFKRKEQNIRLAKMFVFVVVVFAISMFPNQILWLWVDFGDGAENKFFHYISVVCRLFTYANSVLNPFIYALKSREFRAGFARIGRQSMQPLRKISTTRAKDLSRWPHLKSLQIPDVDDKQVTMLIVANVPEVQVHEELSVNFLTYGDELSDQQMRQFLRLDNIYMNRIFKKAMSVEDQEALKRMVNSVREVDGHYEIGMLWKSDTPWLPSKKQMAEARFQSLKRKL
ncbi:galanin receptor type 1-like [Orbicella faveolata]|uniref:galanin receptor type 1-like n=1 Tax=Orbicella faveolata TaxID=48498 RepID=UPI0009E2D675|nr:galanin receptor type 1-like [Orbicella faveolata]